MAFLILLAAVGLLTFTTIGAGHETLEFLNTDQDDNLQDGANQAMTSIQATSPGNQDHEYDNEETEADPGAGQETKETSHHFDIGQLRSKQLEQGTSTSSPNQEEDNEVMKVMKAEADSEAGRGSEVLNVSQKTERKERITLPSMKIFTNTRVSDISPFETFHVGRRVVTNLRKIHRETILPIEKLTLKGQRLNLNLSKEDSSEEVVGEDTTPEIMQNITGYVLTKNINGFPERFFILTYSSGEKMFSLEPSAEYFKSDVEKNFDFKSNFIQEIIINGISHSIYEVEKKKKSNSALYMPLVMVVDDSIIHRFLNETTKGEDAFIEAKNYLMAMNEELEAELGAMSTSTLTFEANIEDVVNYERKSSPLLDEVDVKYLLEDEPMMKAYEDKIAVFLTKRRIVVQQKQVPGIGSHGICNQPRILLQLTEFFQGVKDLVQLLRKTFGICHEKDTNCDMETMEDNLRKWTCLASWHKKPRSVNKPVSLQSQCQFVFGPSYVPCSPHGEDICQKVDCRHHWSITECVSLKSMRALPRTSCAPGRFCKAGKCVLDIGASLELDWPVERGMGDSTFLSIEGYLERMEIVKWCILILVLALVIGSVVNTALVACRNQRP